MLVIFGTCILSFGCWLEWQKDDGQRVCYLHPREGMYIPTYVKLHDNIKMGSRHWWGEMAMEGHEEIKSESKWRRYLANPASLRVLSSNSDVIFVQCFSTKKGSYLTTQYTWTVPHRLGHTLMYRKRKKDSALALLTVVQKNRDSHCRAKQRPALPSLILSFWTNKQLQMYCPRTALIQYRLILSVLSPLHSFPPPFFPPTPLYWASNYFLDESGR